MRRDSNPRPRALEAGCASHGIRRDKGCAPWRANAGGLSPIRPPRSGSGDPMAWLPPMAGWADWFTPHSPGLAANVIRPAIWSDRVRKAADIQHVRPLGGLRDAIGLDVDADELRCPVPGLSCAHSAIIAVACPSCRASTQDWLSETKITRIGRLPRPCSSAASGAEQLVPPRPVPPVSRHWSGWCRAPPAGPCAPDLKGQDARRRVLAQHRRCDQRRHVNARTAGRPGR